MHVLFLSYFFPPDTEIGAQRPDRAVRGIRSNGHTAEIVAYGRGPVGSSIAGVFRTTNSTAFLAHAIQRVLPYNDRIPWVPSAYRLAEARIAIQRPDVIISSAPPFACHFAAYWLSLKYGLPWIADFRDPLSDNPYRSRALAAPLDRFTETRILSRAAVTVMNTEAALRAVAMRHPRFAHKLRLIWNGFDPESRIEARPIAKPGKIVLTHTGSIYGDRHPGPLMRSITRLLQNGSLEPSRIEIQCIGKWQDASFGPDHPVAEKLIKMGVLTVNHQGVPPAEARRIMESASHLLLMDQNEARKGLQVPGKLFEYIRIGRPILCITHPGSMCEFILGQSGIPHATVDPHGPETVFDEKTLRVLEFPPDPVPYSSWFKDTFSMSTQTKQWIDAIEFASSGTASNRG